MVKRNMGSLAIDAGRGGRRKARRAALDNIFQQTRKQVDKAKKAGKPPPEAQQLFDQMYATQMFRGLMTTVNMSADQVIGALLRAGAIRKEVTEVVNQAEKKEKKPGRARAFFLGKSVTWHDPRLRKEVRSLLTWPAVILILLGIAGSVTAAMGQIDATVKFGYLLVLVLGIMAGAVIMGLRVNGWLGADNKEEK